MPKITVTVEFDCPKKEIDNFETLTTDLVGNWAAVKSGIYENRFWGVITAAQVNQKIPRKDANNR